jgi:hypothetical protein
MKNLIKLVLLTAVLTVMFIKTYSPLMQEDKRNIPDTETEISSIEIKMEKLDSKILR